MKTLIQILILSLAVTPSFAQMFTIAPPEGFKILKSDEEEHKKLFEVRKRAIAFIQEGVSNLNEKAKADGKKAIDKLLLAKFAISTNHMSEYLCENSYFFVNPDHPGTIFVCGKTRKYLEHADDQVYNVLGQFTVHESGHWVTPKRGDECNPTLFELAIMNNTRHKILSTVSRDAYASECPGAFAHYDNIESKTGFERVDKIIARNGGGTSSKNSRSSK